MSLLHIFGIAVGLSMDAFAVSVSSGCLLQELQFRHIFRTAFFFGLFQGIMPVLGWLAGSSFIRYIEAIDHWIAFGLLAGIGIKMIWESSVMKERATDADGCISNEDMFMLSIATSIDALAIGVSFSVLRVPIIGPALIISGVTFSICFFGVIVGNKLGHFFENKIEIIGGIVLIGIGLKILVEHLL